MPNWIHQLVFLRSPVTVHRGLANLFQRRLLFGYSLTSMTNGEELKLKLLGATYHFYAISDIIESRIIQCQRAPHKLFGRQNPVVRFQRKKNAAPYTDNGNKFKVSTQAFFPGCDRQLRNLHLAYLLPSIV